jgi:four helix bundle protein
VRGFDTVFAAMPVKCGVVDSYKSLIAWQAASELCLRTLEATDGISERRTWAVLDQLRRAVVSADVNIVEGYALGSPRQFRHHLLIALGSAAEAERLLEIAREREYLADKATAALLPLADRTLGALFGLIKSKRFRE